MTQQSRRSGLLVGTLGLLVSLTCLAVFWVFTPAVFVALIVGVPAAGFAWLVGNRLIGSIGLLVALAPAAMVALQLR